VQGYFDPNIKAVAFSLGQQKYSVFVVISALVFTLLAFFVLIGGIKRIARVSEFFIPLMAGIYVFFCLVIILTNFGNLGDAVSLILKDAFNFKSTAGGFFLALKVGMSRGIFTNEAGLGTAPIAAASAKTSSPFKQGVISMSGTFIDTIIMCPLTGLAIILSGTDFGGDPANVMAQVFKNGVNFLSDRVMEGILTACLVFFAFSTIIGWNFFALSCFRYFTNDKGVKIYNTFYIFAVFVGAFVPFSAVLKLADIFNALMLLPNLIALIFLRKNIINETKLSLNES
jgi:AGCS family alanine or glycine:cation symporter